MLAPGSRNLITDVEGILVGHAEDHAVRSGTTVVFPEERCTAAADVRGGAPGTRDIHALDPTAIRGEVDAIVLSGGSMYGADAASGVVAELGARGRGVSFGGATIPVVPSAILFDLMNGGDKGWGADPPYNRLGRQALAAVGRDFALGNIGAGLGARANMLKGGLGSASLWSDDGVQVGALVAVNSFGSVVMPGTDRFWAGPLEIGEEFGGLGPPPPGWRGEPEMPLPPGFALNPMANTTIAVVAVNALLDKAQAQRLAIMAQDGLARAIRPIHTPFDGDTVFILATGRLPLTGPAMLARLGHLAADTLSRAVARGVFHAQSLGDRPGWAEWRKTLPA
jgi:L-aminopeptidase/D-esterase-like protein